MSLYPTDLQIVDEQLQIQWSDGQARRYQFSELRRKCPCATCRERRQAEAKRQPGQLTVLSADEARPARVTAMKPVGNYAYSIVFSDGHDSGIFTFEFLLELGEPV